MTEHLPEEWRTGAELAAAEEARPLATLQEMEIRHISRVLTHTHGQIGEAARLLGVSRAWLYQRWLNGDGPPKCKVGSRTLIPAAGLSDWLDQYTDNQSKEPGRP